MRRQRGQTLVLVSLMLVVLLGLAALALDGGNAYLQRRQAQTAADAGALAAAKALCSGVGNWQSIGVDYCVNRNGADLCTVVQPADTTKHVVVDSTITVPTTFARILGVNSVTVNAHAEARCSPPAGVSDLVPIVVELPGGYMFSEGQYVDLWYQELGEMGAFGWVNWPDGYSDDPDCPCKEQGNSVPELQCVWANPQCAPWVPADPDPTDDPDGDDYWIDLANTGTHVNPIIDVMVSEWLCNLEGMVVPLYDFEDDSGGVNREYHIIGFGRFVMTGICNGKQPKDQWGCDCPAEDDYNCKKYTGTLPMTCGPSDKIIRGHFVEEVFAGPGNPEGDYYGTYVVHLLE